MGLEGEGEGDRGEEGRWEVRDERTSLMHSDGKGKQQETGGWYLRNTWDKVRWCRECRRSGQGVKMEELELALRSLT